MPTGAIFLHCIPPSRSYLDDPPSISEGWGGRITDYRISVSTYSLEFSLFLLCQTTHTYIAQSILPHAGNREIYEAKIEESEKANSRRESKPVHVQRIVRVGGCLAVVALWQSTGGSSQRCPGFDSQ